MNTAPHRSLLLALTGTALALSLTACQSGADTKSSSAASPEATVASSPVAAASKAGKGTSTGTSGSTTGSTDSASSKGSAGSAGSAAASGGSTGGQAVAATPVCGAGDVRVTAALQDGPPYTHIVLTAKNATSHSCRLA